MTEQTSKAGLYRKIAAIAGAVGSVAKDGYHLQLKYRYPTPATVIEAVKPLLAEHQIAIVPTIVNVVKELTGGKTQSGADKVLTRVELVYLILDGETGEELHVPWVGEGEDWSDKGIAKAQTIALRTFLLNVFQIPSGDDDPDAGQSQPRQSASYEKPAPPVPAPKPSIEALTAGIKLYWQEERKLGGITPSEEILAISSASYDGLIELGKAAKQRVKALKAAQEKQPVK